MSRRTVSSTAGEDPGNRQVDERTAVTVRLSNQSPSADLARLRSRLATGVREGRGLVLDISAVDEFSSRTVAAILWARRSCVARNLPFAVTGQRGRNHRVLQSCGLADQGPRRWR